MRTIYLEWDGPFGPGEVAELDDPRMDYGLYQVYGMHPLYGAEVLLYIGITLNGRTFAAQLSEEQKYWELEEDFFPTNFYVGRLMGVATPAEGVWEEEMELAQHLLAYTYVPVFNSRQLASVPPEYLKEIHLVNWGEKGDLETEVSGRRYLDRFPDTPEITYYAKQGEH